MVHIKRLLAVELGYSYDGTVHIHEHDVALEQKFFHADHPLVRLSLQVIIKTYNNGAILK